MYPKLVFLPTKLICAHYVHTKHCRREQQYEECENSFFITLILPQYRYGIKEENNEGKGEVFSWRDLCD